MIPWQLPTEAVGWLAREMMNNHRLGDTTPTPRVKQILIASTHSRVAGARLVVSFKARLGAFAVTRAFYRWATDLDGLEERFREAYLPP